MSAMKDRGKFEQELLSGERILWTGRPDPAVMFTAGDYFLVPFSLVWGGFAIWMAGTIFGLWGPAHGHDKAPPFPVSVIPLIFPVIGVYFIAGRFVVKALRKKRTWYAITNRRALVLNDGWTRSIQAAMLESLPSINLSVRRNGIGTVRFGNASPFVAMYENTGLELFGGYHGTAVPTFFDVRDASEAHRIAMIQLRNRSG